MMNRYSLTNEGRWRFRRMKADVAKPKIEGYEILEYLYENGPATINDIAKYTGLAYSKVTNKLSVFIHHGYIEKTS